MDDRYRFLSTAIVWVAYAVVMVALFAALSLGAPQFDVLMQIFVAAFVLGLTAVAGISTAMIWRGAGGHAAASPEQAAKAKRVASERIERLVDALNEDEIIELETLLLTRQDQ